ncbi:MAG: hypothetical protein DWQ01_20355 [Planctomycetota bacterium]|nr:MAG: hypothetical protein DWQ01_20355 [Planctomycetota bacterium]
MRLQLLFSAGCLLASATLCSAAGLPPAQHREVIELASKAAQESKGPSREQIQQWLEELQSGDRVARESACRHLMDAGDKAVAPLRKLLWRDLDVATDLAVRRVFGALTGVSPETAHQVETEIRSYREAKIPDPQHSAQKLMDLGAGALAYAQRELKGHKGELGRLFRRLQALEAVRELAAGRNWDDHAGMALAGLGEALIPELTALATTKDLAPAWRTVATDRLLALGGSQGLQPALQLAGDPVADVRRLAVDYASRSAPDDRFGELVEKVSPFLERDPAVQTALLAMGDRVAAPVVRTLLDHRHSAVKAFAAKVIGRRRDTEARSELHDLLRASSVSVVAEALLALGKLGDEEDLDRIARKLRHETPRVRRAAVGAMASLGGERSTAWLTTALSDGDLSVRVRAADQLGRLGDMEALGSLVASLDEDEPELFTAVLASLDALTGEVSTPISSVSSRDQRKRLRANWLDWLADYQASGTEESDSKDADEAENKDLAAPLAPEGARIMGDLAETLRRQFRPYGKLKEKNGTEPEAMTEAARQGMLEVLARKKDPEDPDWLVLQMEKKDQEILRHLLRHGQFQKPRDLAHQVGALPLAISAQDYILLVYEAAGQMVDSLGDRFTRMSVLEDAAGNLDKDALPSLFGKGKSVGCMFEKEDKLVQIEFVFALSPADQAGLRRGDRVVSVNGELATGMEKRQLARALSKPVDLSILRDGWTRPVLFHLEPEAPDPDKLVTSALLPGGIGYVRLQQFELGCAQKLEWAIKELENQDIQGLILDLRGNPGGTVLDAIGIVDKFVPEGETITTTWVNPSPWEKDEKEYEEEVSESTDSASDRSYPMAVLINECSASASEMTSGALQDLERSITVGRTSWGKGIGQSQAGIAGFPRKSVLGENQGTLSLSITILEYFLPTGRSIQGSGVEPEVQVSLPSLLGERFELVQRVRKDSRTLALVDQLLEKDLELAKELATFDAWDEEAYPGFEKLKADLRLELSTNLVRAGVREALRQRLSEKHDFQLAVDVQEDEDLRAAVAALAETLELDLAEIPEFEDLAE